MTITATQIELGRALRQAHDPHSSEETRMGWLKRAEELRAKLATRTMLVHLNIEVPADDSRSADAIADDILAGLQILGGELEISAPLAEEI